MKKYTHSKGTAYRRGKNLQITRNVKNDSDFWCFDTRNEGDEFEVVIWDHNANDVDNDPDFKWQNFIEWLDTTMEDEDDEDFDLDNEE